MFLAFQYIPPILSFHAMFGRQFPLRRNPSEKLRERALRRLAATHSYRLIRSPSRDRAADEFGTYALIDAVRLTIEFGGRENGYGMTLDEIEKVLTEISSVSKRIGAVRHGPVDGDHRSSS